MTEHTPGPWVLRDYGASYSGKMALLGGLDHGGKFPWLLGSIQVCHKSEDAVGWQPWPEGEANARLIAAAPDLLAACYTALHFTANIDPWWEPSHQQTVATLRAAIAKARGHDAGG